MESLKKILFNVIFYITIIAIIAVLLLAALFVVMKLNVYALTGDSGEPVTVLIDAGHGGEDGGAVGNSGLLEKDVNLDIALQLRRQLEFSGFRVYMTRQDDDPIGTGDTVKERYRSDMAQRLEMYRSTKNDIVISIHQNNFTSPDACGAQVFYSPNNKKSERLAECIRRSLCGLLQPDNTRDITKAGSNIYLLNNCDKPCVLAECGFLSNPDEEELLSDREYRQKIAFALYCGVLEYTGQL